MAFFADSALGVTLSLLTIFGGIGALVGVLVFYAVAQVIGEHRENQERRQRRDG